MAISFYFRELRSTRIFLKGAGEQEIVLGIREQFREKVIIFISESSHTSTASNSE